MTENNLLAFWLFLVFVEFIFLIGGSVYLVLWKHCSGWWIVLAIILSSGNSTLFKVLAKKFNVEFCE